MEEIKVYKKLSSLADLKKKDWDYHSVNMAIENSLQRLLEEKGIKQKELADLTGISRQTVYSIIKENSCVGIDSALKIAYVLNVPVEDIFHLNKESWVRWEKDKDEKGLYVDHKNLWIVNKDAKQELENQEGKNLFVNIETLEVREKKNVPVEMRNGEMWRPRFEKLVRHFPPIKLK